MSNPWSAVELIKVDRKRLYAYKGGISGGGGVRSESLKIEMSVNEDIEDIEYIEC